MSDEETSVREWAALDDDSADAEIMVYGPVVARMARELLAARKRVVELDVDAVFNRLRARVLETQVVRLRALHLERTKDRHAELQRLELAEVLVEVARDVLRAHGVGATCRVPRETLGVPSGLLVLWRLAESIAEWDRGET